MNLAKIPVLVLNSSYEAITILSARRALTLVSKGAALTEVPTNARVHRTLEIYIPSVIRLRNYAKIPHRRPIPSRANIFRRDNHTCLYCGRKSPKVILELEHILPRSRGGTGEWHNLATSCHECNQMKGDRTPQEANMSLLHKPLPSSVHTSRFLLKTLGKEINEWQRFLWVDSDGDRRYVTVN